MASSLSEKLGRLPALSRGSVPLSVAEPEQTHPERIAEREAVEPPQRASLDELRDRIAAILARPPAICERPAFEPQSPKPRKTTNGPSWIEHAFVEEETRHGPLYRSRKSTPHGHRVGAVPLWPALSADAALLALLALDPSIAACDPARALYVDTETTGLSGGTGTVAFLVGLGSFDLEGGGFVVEQLLLRSFAHEAAMVEHLRRRIEEASVIVTFNGKSFDLPLLRTRATMNRMSKLPGKPHLDLLHVVRRLHRHRLSSCALGRIEDEILGQARVDDVSGADIPAIYHHYVRTADVAALEPVVHHNALDVISMVALVSLYGERLEGWAGAPHGAHGIAPTDLAAASTVARRAGDLETAHALAQYSVDRGAGLLGHRARGDVAKARGDKAAALADYERALEADATTPSPNEVCPALRLELAKLYEHHAKAFDKALAALARGTTEDAGPHQRRVDRLVSKLEKKPSRPLRDGSSSRAAKAKKTATALADASKLK